MDKHYKMHYVDVFVEDENVCKLNWIAHMSKIYVMGLATSRPTSEAGCDLKIT